MMTGSHFTIDRPEGGGAAGEADNEVHVTEGYLETMGIRLLKGRLLTGRDSIENRPVALISEGLARMFGANANPIGRRLRASPSGRLGRETEEVREIVGVVGDVRDRSYDMSPVATVYLPFGAKTDHRIAVAFRKSFSSRRLTRS